LVYSLSFVYLI